MKITNIKINNIKGIESNDMEVEIFANKPNILVAPNGFGKSSIACAFNSLTKYGIKLTKEEDYYKKDISLQPLLSLKVQKEDGGSIYEYLASKNVNEIGLHFKTFVINNQLDVTTKSNNQGKFTSVSGYLSIKPQIIYNKIPENVKVDYTISHLKNKFGKNGKLLPNISDLLFNDSFLNQIKASDYYSILDKFKAKGRQKKFNLIIDLLNNGKGTEETIKKNFDTGNLLSIEKEDSYERIKQLVKSYKHFDDLDTFLIIYQIQYIYLSDKNTFKNACNRAEYNSFKAKIEDNLQLINTSWLKIKPKEHNEQLIINYPKANEISNGQRDLLTMFIMLTNIENKLKIGNNIIIFDEVFDYLDDANLLAAQFYITKMIKRVKDKKIGSIFPIFLTHLDPYYFKNYVFRKQKVCFLLQTQAIASSSMKKLLSKREEESIYIDISKYLLHYHPNEINCRVNFEENELKPTWGIGTNFLKYIIEELNKYFYNESNYDPYAVCCALRIYIEKKVYKQLSNENKVKFLKINGTNNKLEFAEQQLVKINEIYFMLGIIYNDSMHINETEKSSAYKLNNITIKEIIKDVFNYKGNEISLEAIH